MTISDRIELLRKKKGVSLVYLNNAIGAYRGKITEVKKNKASFNDTEVNLLAQALSTSPDYLLGRTDDPTPAGQKGKPPAMCGEPISPNKRELLELVDSMSEDEMAALLDLVKATRKMRRADD